jgi:hypothetical protein
VAEGARLESVFTRKGNVGSNPTLSATFQKGCELTNHCKSRSPWNSHTNDFRVSLRLFIRDYVSVHIHCRPDVRVTHELLLNGNASSHLAHSSGSFAHHRSV